jgi:hypothetical protein
VGRGREPAHVRAGFDQDLLCSSAADARNLIQAVQSHLKREHSLRNLLVQAGDFGLKRVQQTKLAAKKESLVVANRPGEGSFQHRNLGAQRSLGHTGNCGRVVDAVGQGLKHRPTRNAHDVAGDVAELDVGAFQQLLYTLDKCRPLFDKRAPIAHELTAFSTLTVGDEAGLQQPVLKQLG